MRKFFNLLLSIWNFICNSWAWNLLTLNFDPYQEQVRKRAETLKAVAQMFIGVLIFIALMLHLTFKTSCVDLAVFTESYNQSDNARIGAILFPEFDKSELEESESFKNRLDELKEPNNPLERFIHKITEGTAKTWILKYLCIEPLEIVASGLALTAGIELAYMLFTPGPDEAVDPLILGFASTVLLIISKTDPKVPKWENALIVLVFSGALGFLFYIRLKFLKPNKNNKYKEINLVNTDLSQKNFAKRNLSEANLINADLSFSNLQEADLKSTKLINAYLRGTNFTNAKLKESQLILANLSYADLKDANLTNADLTNANLTNANLTNADLKDANLTNANLTNADLTNADLTGANLTGVDLRVIQAIDRAIFYNASGLNRQQKEDLRNRKAKV